MSRAAVLVVFALVGVVALADSIATTIVVDVDGSLEDYAALTTILRHPIARTQLKLVTVNGDSWGELRSVEKNIRAFLTLAGLGTSVQVAIGQSRSLNDAYNTTTGCAACANLQGFPRTPMDAAARGMVQSRYDVSTSFGAAYALPSVANLNVKSADATTVLLNLLQPMIVGQSRVVYFALTSLSNLARALQTANTQGSLANAKKLLSLQIFENGNNLAADPAATAYILGTGGFANTPAIFTPTLYSPSVAFSFSTWLSFTSLAAGSVSLGSGDASQLALKWLASAWTNKKAKYDGISSTAFFSQRGPASCLVVLCAVDSTVNASCGIYYGAPTTAALVFSAATGVSSATFSPISGNNVTASSFLQYPATAGSGAASGFVPVDTTASKLWPGQTSKLVDVFWSRWQSILGAGV